MSKSFPLSLFAGSLLFSGTAFSAIENFSNQKQGTFTALKSSLGVFKAQSGQASVYKASADQKPGSLRLNGGKGQEVTLELAPSLQKPLLYLTFNGERWTGADPFQFKIEGKQGKKWKKVYDGNKLQLRQLQKMPIQVDLKGETYQAFRFVSTTKEGSGVLVDNIQIVQDGEMKILGLMESQLQVPALIRGGKSPLLSFDVEAEGSKKADKVVQAVISTEGTTDIKDVDSYTLYAGKNGSTDPATATRLGSQTAGKKLVFDFDYTLTSGVNRFFLIASISDKANQSHRVNATLGAVKLANAGVLRSDSKPNGVKQRIGFNVATGGDTVVRTDGSSMVCRRMRIPGMVTTNAGTLLAVYDLRWKQNGDLPGDIDVGLSRSTDGGKSWEAPRPVLDMGQWLGQPENKNGVGDPAILVDRKTGHIYISGLVAHGLSSGWYWGKSKPGMDPKDTGQVVIVKSEDDGLTWSKPRNLTPEIKNPEWQLMLQGPGAGISMRDGTLVFAFQYKQNIGTKAKPRYSARSSILYSKDHGKSWKVAPGVDYPQETTEAQVVELNDGSLMLNCRISAGGRAVFTSKDLGQTWVKHPTSGRGTFNMTGCMASILRYSSTKDGDEKDILLFSGPADGGKKRRSHMSIRYSLDEGESWSAPYLLDQIGGAYSCLSLVHDGEQKDIGLIYEGSQSNMTFERLSLKELMSQ